MNVQTRIHRSIVSLRNLIAIVATSVCFAASANTPEWGLVETKPGLESIPGAISVSNQGMLNYAIPFELPKGPNGLTPGLGLVHSTDAGNGILGARATLSGLSEIARCRDVNRGDKALFPINNSLDRLCLNGESLEHDNATVENEAGRSGFKAGDVFRVRSDGRTKVEVHALDDGRGGDDPNSLYMIVKQPDGSWSRYGFTKNSRQSRYLDTDPPGGATIRWKLDTVGNADGQIISYVYEAVTVKDGPVEMRADLDHRLKEIAYAGRRILFTYELRNDPLAGYHQGAYEEVRSRLVRIDTYAPSAEDPFKERLVRSYLFSYETSTGTNRSLLSRVEECVQDAPEKDVCRRPTRFWWSSVISQPEIYHSGFAYAGVAFPVPATLSTQVFAQEFVDANADGKYDILVAYKSSESEKAPKWWLWETSGKLSDGEAYAGPVKWNAPFHSNPSMPPIGTFELYDAEKPGKLLKTVNLPLPESPPGHLVGDFTGNGRPDMLLLKTVIDWNPDFDGFSCNGGKYCVKDVSGFYAMRPSAFHLHAQGAFNQFSDNDVSIIANWSNEPLSYSRLGYINTARVARMLPNGRDQVVACVSGPREAGGNSEEAPHFVPHRDPWPSSGNGPHIQDDIFIGYWRIYDVETGFAQPPEALAVSSPLVGACSGFAQVMVFDSNGDGLDEVHTWTTNVDYFAPTLDDYRALAQQDSSALSYNVLSFGASGKPRHRLPRAYYAPLHSRVEENVKCLSGSKSGKLCRTGGDSGDRLADLNGDGLLDLVRFHATPESFLPVFGGQQGGIHSYHIQTWINTGDGFVRGHDLEAGLAQNPVDIYKHFLRFQHAALVDLNSDGRAELVIAAKELNKTDTTPPIAIAYDAQGTHAIKETNLPILKVLSMQGERIHWLPLTSDQSADLLISRVAPGFNADERCVKNIVLDTWSCPPSSWAIATRSDQFDVLQTITDGAYQHEIFYSNSRDPKTVGDNVPGYAIPFNPQKYEGANFYTAFAGFRRQHSFSPIVSMVMTSTGANAPGSPEHRITQYRYTDPRYDNLNRRFIGFARRAVLDLTAWHQPEPGEPPVTRVISERFATAEWIPKPNDPFKYGLPVERVEVVCGGSELNARVSSYEYDVVYAMGFNGNAGFKAPYANVVPKSTLIEEFEVIGDPTVGAQLCFSAEGDDWHHNVPERFADAGLAPVRSVLTDYVQYDAFLNPVRVEELDDGTQTVTWTQYLNSASAWRLGLPTWKTVIHHTPEEVVGRHVAFEYNENFTLRKSIREPQHPNTELWLETSFAYDAFGNVVYSAVRDAKQVQRSSSATYDGFGVFPVQLVNDLGHKTELRWEPGLGVPLTTLSPGGILSARRFDRFGRHVWSADFKDGKQIGSETTTAYHDLGAAGSRIKVQVAGLGVREQVRSRFGFPIAETWPGLNGEHTVVIERRFNGRGQLVAQSAPRKQGEQDALWSKRYFDRLGRVRHVENTDGSMVTYGWSGLLSSTLAPNTALRQVERDRRGNIVRIRDGHFAKDANDPTAYTDLCYTYGAFDLLLRIEPCDGEGRPATVITYDKLGRRISMFDPATGLEQFAYDAFGNVVQSTDASGNTQMFEYDSLGRKVASLSPQGQSTWLYDGQFPGLLDGTVSDQGHSEKLTYDDFGRLVSSIVTIAGQPFARSLGYDEFGRVAERSLPGIDGKGFELRYHYDDFGHLQQVDASGQMAWRLDQNDPFGGVRVETFGNGLKGLTSFDALTGRLYQQKVLKAGDPAPLQHLEYEWNQNGNLHSRWDLRSMQGETFEYDAKERLVRSWVQSANGGWLQTVDYDRFGNITHKSDVGGFEYDAQHRLVATPGRSYGYDQSGRLTLRTGLEGSTYIDYSALGQPLRMWREGQVDLEFGYMADGSRVLKRDLLAHREVITLGEYKRTRSSLGQGDVVHTYQIHAGGRLVAEVERVQVGGTAQLVSETRRYVHSDHLGSPATVTNGAGAVIARESHDAWGKRRNAWNWAEQNAALPAPLLHVGFNVHAAELDDGFTHMGARLYMADLGRFASPDPLMSAPFTVEDHNRYSYAWNTPLVVTDPSGLSEAQVCTHDDDILDCGEMAPKTITVYGEGDDSSPVPDPSQGNTTGEMVDSALAAYWSTSYCYSCLYGTNPMPPGATLGTVAEANVPVPGMVRGDASPKRYRYFDRTAYQERLRRESNPGFWDQREINRWNSEAARKERQMIMKGVEVAITLAGGVSTIVGESSALFDIVGLGFYTGKDERSTMDHVGALAGTASLAGASAPVGAIAAYFVLADMKCDGCVSKVLDAAPGAAKGFVEAVPGAMKSAGNFFTSNPLCPGCNQDFFGNPRK